MTGRATIAAHSTIDTTDEVGTVTGTLTVGKTQTHFSAVYDHGTVAGTATGHTGSRTQLLANVSASFSAADGFTAGKIGGGTAAGGAVIYYALKNRPPGDITLDILDSSGKVVNSFSSKAVEQPRPAR